MKWILNPIVFAIVSGILLMYLTQGSRIQHFIGAAICLGVAAFFFKEADLYAAHGALPAVLKGFYGDQNDYFPYIAITAAALGFIPTIAAESETDCRAKLKLPWRFLAVPEIIAGMGLITHRAGALNGFLEGLGGCYAITAAFCLLVGLFGRFVRKVPKTEEEKAEEREEAAARRQQQKEERVENRRNRKEERAEKLANMDLKAEVVKKGIGILYIAAAVCIALVKKEVLPVLLFEKVISGIGPGAAVMETWLGEHTLSMMTTPFFCALLALTGLAEMNDWALRGFFKAIAVPAGFAMALAPWLPQLAELQIGSWTFKGGENVAFIMFLFATVVCGVLYAWLTLSKIGEKIRIDELRAIMSIAITIVTLPVIYIVIWLLWAAVSPILMFIAVPVVGILYLLVKYNDSWNG